MRDSKVDRDKNSKKEQYRIQWSAKRLQEAEECRLARAREKPRLIRLKKECLRVYIVHLR